MNIQIIIPVRALDDGKRRLSTVLTPSERRALNGWFFRRTVAVARSVLPASRILLVSAAPDLLAYGRAAGLVTVAEQQPGDLNAALRLGALAARENGADATLSVSCDLPFLGRDDLQAMINAARPGGVVLAPDRYGTGTNALLVAPVGGIGFHYGQNSFQAHRDAAVRAGLPLTVMRRRGLGFDIDVSADLEAFGMSAQRLAATG